jgi:spore maturation protein CgeB
VSSLDVVVLGLSITSAWGNGHATTYRSLVRGLRERGHRVLFLERDVSWYGDNRDLPEPPWCELGIYRELDELRDRYSAAVREADLVIVGSYVPDGIAVGEWVNQVARGVTAFYDIDTPVTAAALAEGRCNYMDLALAVRFDLYLSFAGGGMLRRLHDELGVDALPLYCSVDPDAHRPLPCGVDYDLGYLGTYAPDRQPALDRLMLAPAGAYPELRFAVFGPGYPPQTEWPDNVHRAEHLSPQEHARFYCSQRYTLNLTRADMVRAGHSPSVRLFEAAACGVPVISDYWTGLEDYFRIGEEILVALDGADTLRYLLELPENERLATGQRARRRVLAQHTGAHRALELEQYLADAAGGPLVRRSRNKAPVAGSPT